MEDEMLKAVKEASIREAEDAGHRGFQYEFGQRTQNLDLSKFLIQPPISSAPPKQMSKKELKYSLVIQGYQVAEIEKALSDVKSAKPTLEELKQILASNKKGQA
jgi:ribosomal protein L20